MAIETDAIRIQRGRDSHRSYVVALLNLGSDSTISAML